jgi:hypothetical protein
VFGSADGDGPREEMVYNLKLGPVSGALRSGDYKLLFGKRFQKQGWYDVDNTALQCNRMTRNKKEKKKAERHKDDGEQKKKTKKKGDRKKEKRQKERRQRNLDVDNKEEEKEEMEVEETHRYNFSFHYFNKNEK